MNTSDAFDMFLLMFFLLVAIVTVGALAGIVDNYLDPHCNCKDMRRQELETGGVEL